MVETTTSILKRDGMVRKGGIQVKKKIIAISISSLLSLSSSHGFCPEVGRSLKLGQCLGFCKANFSSSLAYESAVHKPKHCLT